jgi:hypothetical protein
MNDTQLGRRFRRRATITIEIVPVADIDDRIVLRDLSTGEAVAGITLSYFTHERELVAACAKVVADAIDAGLL